MSMSFFLLLKSQFIQEPFHMIKSTSCAMAVAVSMAIAPSVSSASVFGYLGNFDVINDTGSMRTVLRLISKACTAMRSPIPLAVKVAASQAAVGLIR